MQTPTKAHFVEDDTLLDIKPTKMRSRKEIEQELERINRDIVTATNIEDHTTVIVATSARRALNWILDK